MTNDNHQSLDDLEQSNREKFAKLLEALPDDAANIEALLREQEKALDEALKRLEEDVEK